METNTTNMRKHKTGISGLDALFYGGIQIEPKSKNADGLLIMARGEHGVNKIHLAMQMCEGLYISQNEDVNNPNIKERKKQAFEKFYPLSVKYGDKITLLTVLTIVNTRKIIKLYAENQEAKYKEESNNKWKKFCEKYNKDVSFASMCATLYIEKVLSDIEKELVDQYFNRKKGKKDIENELDRILKEGNGKFDNLFLEMYEKEQILIKETKSLIKKYAEDWKNNDNLSGNEKYYWEEFNRKFNAEASFAQRSATAFIDSLLLENNEAFLKFYKSNKRSDCAKEELLQLLENNIINENNEIRIGFLSNRKAHLGKNLLFVSLNKDGGSLKSKYYDFYIQRLIRNIRSDNEFADSSVELLSMMMWYEDESCCEYYRIKDRIIDKYNLLAISPNNNGNLDIFKQHIKSGFIYYNGRTHGLHLRHQKGAPDTEDMLLCKLFVPEDSLVKIIGRDELNEGNRMADGLTSFQNLLTRIDTCYQENNGKFECIMVDGLSRLTKEEIAQCPFNALSDKLRKACKVGVITADEKLKSSDVSVDIVIDMAIKERSNPDQLYHALNISKCLYQRNAYGWHSYFMRMAGIEVIPSLQVQMTTRYHMDDSVADALLPISEDPYPYWLNESNLYFDEQIRYVQKKEGKSFYERVYERNKSINSINGSLKGFVSFEKDFALRKILDELRKPEYYGHSFLFIDLNYSRTEFKRQYSFVVDENNNTHLFTFQPGYLHADEFLWVIDQQVQAISNTNKEGGIPNTHYKRTHIIIGDLNYINFAYPCLNNEGLVLPAIASYTKKHHMTNFVYASVPSGSNIKLLDKETEIIRQMWAVVGIENMMEK